MDTTSSYWEVEVPDGLAELAETVDDDVLTRPAESGTRRFGHSKDFRTDLPQVVIAMAVTRDGVPVRCWTFPGTPPTPRSSAPSPGGLDGWNLRRILWVADRGLPPPPTGPT